MSLKSFLSKFGHDVLTVVGIIGKVEAVAEPVVETLFPASIPVFNIFDKVINLVTANEAAFAAVGQASNGAAKLQAILGAVSAELDGWVSANLPGSAEILKSTQYIQAKSAIATQYVNAVVAFLNSLPAGTATTTSASATVAAAAASAALQAAQSTVK